MKHTKAEIKAATEKFNAELAMLLAKIKSDAEAQFDYNVKNNIVSGLVKLEDAAEHAIDRGVVSALSSRSHFDTGAAFKIAAEIVEDVNCHEVAKMIRNCF